MSTTAKLADFFTGKHELLPRPVKSRLWTTAWVSKARMALTRLYWAQRDPVIYLKCLCSEASALLRQPLKLDLTDTVVAPARCSVLSSNMQAAATAAFQGEPMMRHINRFTTTYSAHEWANGEDVTQAALSHVVFIWSAAMAIGHSQLEQDSITEENIRWLNQCVPHFTQYVECLIKLQQR